MDSNRVVVVGAGLAGLTCGRELSEQGLAPLVLDKGRRPGGRSCSRSDAEGHVFDHGAQFFTAHDEWTRERVGEWERAGVVARWEPRGARREHAPWWVGTPSMGALAAHLAQGLDVRCSQHVTALVRGDAGWRIHTRDAEYAADVLVVAIPAPQAAALLGSVVPGCAFDPCWAALVRLEEGGHLDVLERSEGAFSWAAREASKPDRTRHAGEDAWVVHASAAWSAEHLEDSPEDVAETLAATLAEALGARRVGGAHAHRWRYAKPSVEDVQTCVVDAGSKLVICGDWMQSPRVEGALLSGRAAARRALALE